MTYAYFSGPIDSPDDQPQFRGISSDVKKLWERAEEECKLFIYQTAKDFPLASPLAMFRALTRNGLYFCVVAKEKLDTANTFDSVFTVSITEAPTL